MSAMIHVYAQWDAAASVWVAESDDVPGLVTEAETLEGLAEKLRVLIPELAQENGFPHPVMMATRSISPPSTTTMLGLPSGNSVKFYA